MTELSEVSFKPARYFMESLYSLNRWKDWWGQAFRDKEKAHLDHQHAYYEWACFVGTLSHQHTQNSQGIRIGRQVSLPSIILRKNQRRLCVRVKISTTSAKLFYLDREELLEELHKFSQEPVESFPTGRSDANLVVVVSEDLGRKNFWKVYREPFNFFADRLPIAFDLIVTDAEKRMSS